MSKELYFTDGNNEVKYLDTTASFNLAITQDGSAFDLTNATAIDVKVANDTGYVFDKSIDMATIKQPLAGLITMPVDAEVMNALVPDDYTIEVWVTLSSLITPGSQEGLTDTGSTTTTATTPTTTATTPSTNTATPTTTYNAIFPSDDPQGFTITENVMSDSGDVIPVMSLDDFQQEFDQLKTDLTNKVSTLQGPKGDKGDTGTVDNTGLISAPAFQSLQTQVDNSAVGTNLLSGTAKIEFPFYSNNGTQTINKYDDETNYLQYTSNTPVNSMGPYFAFTPKVGEVYTLSADVCGNGNTMGYFFHYEGGDAGSLGQVDLTNDWQRISNTFRVNTISGNLIIYANDSTLLKIKNIKIEKGSVATDWFPNPSEILTQSDYAKIKAAIVALGGALS